MGASIHKDLDKILEEYPELGIRLEEGQGLADIFKMRGMTRKNQLQRFMLEVGERYGIGPQFAARTGYQVGGRGRQAFEMMSTAVRTTGLEYAGEVPGQVLAKTWEGGVFWGLMEKLGLKKMGPVRRWQDLGFIEKLKTKMGITPHRLVAKSVGGKMVHQKVPVAKLLDEMGQELNVARSFSDARAMKGYESYAFKGARQGISDWLNYHINRPTWLLQEMTGLGMRPGKTPLESLYKIGTRVALPAYLGWQMLQYAEYKTRKHLGYGPISGPMKIFLEGRATAQSMLDSSGITEKAKEIEEQFPGAIESPFSKLLVGLTGTFGGAYAGRRLGGARGAAIGLVTGLSIGLMNAAGITTPADELREMYEGEREVPVRADRWWALGRHPFSGSRIKYWKKHWFAEMMSDYKGPTSLQRIQNQVLEEALVRRDDVRLQGGRALRQPQRGLAWQLAAHARELLPPQERLRPVLFRALALLRPALPCNVPDVPGRAACWAPRSGHCREGDQASEVQVRLPG
jgi:hypothetical protein